MSDKEKYKVKIENATIADLKDHLIRLCLWSKDGRTTEVRWKLPILKDEIYDRGGNVNMVNNFLEYVRNNNCDNGKQNRILHKVFS